MNDLLIAVRAAHFAATLLVVGAVCFEALVLAPALEPLPRPDDAAAFSRTLRRIGFWSLIVAAGTIAAWLAIFASTIGGEASNSLDLAASVLRETQFGRVSLVRLVVAVALGILLVRSETRGVQRLAAVVLVTIFAVGPSANSHAGAVPGTGGALTLAGDMLHIVAAGIWLGGLLPLVLVLGRARRRPQHWGTVAAQATRRFSVLAVGSVAAIVVTGTLNAALLVGSVELLLATLYGRIILFKVALLLLMLAFAALNKFRLTPLLPKPGPLTRLQRNSVAEIGLGLAVVGLAAALGTLPPAAHHHLQASAATDAAFVHLHGITGMAEVTIAPGRPGPVAVKITLLAEDFTPLVARSVTFTFSSKSAGIGPRTVQATRVGDGVWRIEGLTIGAAGRWDVLVEADIDATRRLSLDGPMLIEP